MLLIVFTISMFVSASLLFLVEPMLAKMALPLLGGSPAVWNTCLVFFQAVLLAGYLYAHATTKWLGRRTQIAVHICVALLPFAVLPLHIPAGWEPPTQTSPVLWTLGMLSVAVGLPFFLLSSSTPVLQRWFAHSGHASAHDPYFLYAASNAGSLVGLLGYPLLLEPTLRLSVQSHLWSYGYLLFVLMTAACATLVWRAKPNPTPQTVETLDSVKGTGFSPHISPAESTPASAPEDRAAAPAHLNETTWPTRLRWIALAFVPSSLMMGVTTELTTDVPAVPLLWVMPLAIYLLSFVLVFASKPPISHVWLVRRLPLLILLSLYPIVSKSHLPLPLLFPLYMATLFAIAMVCHGELARSRPGASRLTEFYLLISVGGVLGGIFNSLLAPVIFSTVVEFPLALVFAAFLRPAVDVQTLTPQKAIRVRRNDWLLPLALGLVTALAITLLQRYGVAGSLSVQILLFGYSMLWCMSFGKRPLRFALGLSALLLACSLYTGAYGKFLDTERSFFGVLRVGDSPNGNLRYLFHGAIIHGIQSLDASGNPAGPGSREPLSYYSRSGPAGSVLRELQSRSLRDADGSPRKPRWAVVGLGAGAMACYYQTGESLTFYEIDPAVRRIAIDPKYFTFLQQCAPAATIILGDARLKLRDSANAGYDLIVLDAFSGDTIPMHLITREAIALYLRKLSPGGILAFHISNSHLRLAPVFAALAQDAGLQSRIDDDTTLTHAEFNAGKSASQWMVMARTQADLGALATNPHWTQVQLPPNTQVWTDDYSNLLRIIKWN